MKTETSKVDAGAVAGDERQPLILVADDEPVNLALIRRRLEWEDYRVVTADDGGEAVEAARATLPDLVIMDVMMPVMDGLQACRLLKEDPATRDIPVIFLSALDDTDTKVRGLDLGANDYVSKPFRVEELLARVSVAIRLKLERDRLRRAPLWRRGARLPPHALGRRRPTRRQRIGQRHDRTRRRGPLPRQADRPRPRRGGAVGGKNK